MTAPCSRWASASASSRPEVGVALGAHELEADGARRGRRPLDERPDAAQRGRDVEHAARVELDEQQLARRAACGRPASSEAARVRASKEYSASWASAAWISSPPRTSTLPMRPRISASRP